MYKSRIGLESIGFIQGRLSPKIDGEIQAFPWPYWRNEFEVAKRYGFGLMEWTLDQDRLYENPLMTEEGRIEIRNLMKKNGIRIPSLTGDCFMQSPFFKMSGKKRKQLLDDLVNITEASAALDINTILMPLVDNGRLENESQENDLFDGLLGVQPLFEKTGVIISFESDFPPKRLANLINKFDVRFFGITYDIGNSAFLGYNYEEEIEAYGARIINIHVKDRLMDGRTVPLGMGNADIPGVLRTLRNIGYTGNYILQTARAVDGDHSGVLCRYRDMVINWLHKVDK